MGVEARPEITRAPVTAIVIGLAAGMFSALLGVGGGLLMVPAMMFLLRIRPHRAHGTSLAVVLPTAIAGTYGYSSHGNVDWPIAWLLAIGGVIGAMLGARWASRLSGPFLKRTFGVFVVLIGILLMLPPFSAGHAPHALIGTLASGWPIVILVGVVAGTVSGLLGVGGGIIMIPAVVFLLGLPQKMAQGISLAVIVPVAISGGLIHYLKGNVIPNLSGWLACGAVVGAIVISHLVGSIEDETLKMVFGIFLIVVGVSTATRHRGSEDTTH